MTAARETEQKESTPNAGTSKEHKITEQSTQRCVHTKNEKREKRGEKAKKRNNGRNGGGNGGSAEQRTTI